MSTGLGSGFFIIPRYTNDLSEEALVAFAINLAQSFDYPKTEINFNLIYEEAENRHKALKSASMLTAKDKIAYLETVYQAAKNDHESVRQVIANLIDDTKEVLIANTEGRMVKDVRHLVRPGLTVIAAKDGVLQSANDSIGRNSGFKIFDKSDLEAFGKSVESVPYPVSFENETMCSLLSAFFPIFSGESVIKKTTLLQDKLSEAVVSDKISIIDNPLFAEAYSQSDFDDEGVSCKAKTIISKGVFNTFLHNLRTAGEIYRQRF